MNLRTYPPMSRFQLFKTILPSIDIGLACGFYWFVVGSLAVHGTCLPLPRRTSNIRPEHVIDEWIGFTDTDTVLYRLILKSDRTGDLYAVYADEKLICYKLSNWSMSTNYVLRCQFDGLSEPQEPATMTCIIYENRLVAKLIGRGGWQKEIVFRRESII